MQLQQTQSYEYSREELAENILADKLLTTGDFAYNAYDYAHYLSAQTGEEQTQIVKATTKFVKEHYFSGTEVLELIKATILDVISANQPDYDWLHQLTGFAEEVHEQCDSFSNGNIYYQLNDTLTSWKHQHPRPIGYTTVAKALTTLD